MKISFLFWMLLIVSANANAQQFSVSADKMNIAYIGIDNPLTIVADNCSCTNLFAITKNGELIKKDSCRFIYRPVREGDAMITVQKKQNGKLITIAQKEMKAKYIPNPRASIGGKSEGSFPLDQFKLQQGIIISFDHNFEMDLKFAIVSFRIIILYKNGVQYSEDIVGNRFLTSTIDQFKNLKAGDKVLIEAMRCKGPDNTIRTMNAMIFTLR